jgi:archaellum component FlaF (FlaF/FlaG flagellin family)
MRVKRTSERGHYPAEELIESASLIMGKQVIEELTGEYIRIHNAIMDTPDRRDARYRMSDFEVSDDQGTEKLLYCNIPFYFTHKGCCLPLISLQYTQPEIVIKFKSSVMSFDPTYQPQIQVTGEYVYLDDTEREWWASQEHDMLFPYVQMVEDRVDIEQSRIENKYTPLDIQTGVPSSILGPAEPYEDSIIVTQGGQDGFTYINLVDPEKYPGNSVILYDTGSNARTFTIKAAMLLPKDGNNNGSVSALWARRAGDIGYECEFIVEPSNQMHINVYRNGQVIVSLDENTVFTSAMTTVTGDSSSYDIRSDTFAADNPSIDVTQGSDYEIWVDIDITHNLEDFSRMTVAYTIGLYEASGGGRLNNEQPSSTKDKYFEVSEGYSAVDTLGIPTQMGFAATSNTFPAIITDISMSTRQIEKTPIDDNLTHHKTPIYTRGPVRFMAWVTTPLDPNHQWGAFSTGDRGTYVTRFDPLDSAQILINGKPRTEMEDASYFSVYHPLETIQRSLPSGVHFYSFSHDPTDFSPDASMNFSRAGSVVLSQRFKKWNPTATSLGELRASETFAAARDFKRIRIYMVGYNVLMHRDGQVALQCV